MTTFAPLAAAHSGVDRDLAFAPFLRYVRMMNSEEQPARILPIELSSVVVTLETLTRELTKKLTAEERREVVDVLCSKLRALTDEKRSPSRPFNR